MKPNPSLIAVASSLLGALALPAAAQPADKAAIESSPGKATLARSARSSPPSRRSTPPSAT